MIILVQCILLALNGHIKLVETNSTNMEQLLIKSLLTHIFIVKIVYFIVYLHIKINSHSVSKDKIQHTVFF